SALAPALAVLISHLPGGVGIDLFYLAFIPLGMTPLVWRILMNYALEICQPHQHPRYLSVVTLSLALPFALSPLVGWVLDLLDEAVRFEYVFLSAAGLVVLSGLLTFRLDEPRQRLGIEKTEAADVGTPE
ncbi:MAG: hypothetical protein ACYTG0_28820, partial [Planctomycetota bacterium]